MQPRLYAAVDLGTNTAKLTIGSLNSSGAVVREHFEAVPVRLGEDLALDGQIGDQAIRRAIACLETFAGRLEAYDLAGVRAVSTKAMRSALNADDVVSLIKTRTGFNIEVIAGEDEARLSLEALAVQPGEGLAVLNCGGGSTELALVTAAQTSFASLDLGALALSQRYLQSDPPRYVEARWLMDEIAQQLEGLVKPSVSRLIAQGGTAVNLAALNRAANPRIISRAALGELIKLFMGLNLEGRRHLAGLEAARADTILAGAFVHQGVLEHLGLDEFEVSLASISDGLIRRMALNLN